MRLLSTRTLRMAAVAFVLVACDAGRMVGPGTTALVPEDAASRTLTASGPSVVISQVYGGGGNTGSTLKNDFIELHNRSGVAVDVSGWSVQYASKAGTSWSVTAIAGVIQPGAYYLVQEAAGTGGTASLPAPNATGTIAMSATDGKVILMSTTTAASGSCPAVTAPLLDYVGFGGSTTTDTCLATRSTPALTNTSAALRLADGCTYTGDVSKDFTTGAPAPRNSASPAKICGVVVPAKPLASITVSPATANVVIGSNQTFTAKGFDVDGREVSFTPSWSSSASTVVSISSTWGIAKGESIGDAKVIATSGEITGTANVNVVTAPPPPSGLPATRITEIHYDNGGDDANEAIEIEGDAGTSLTSWTLQLYTGSTGTVYRTIPLAGVFTTTCNGRSAISFDAVGIQNGVGSSSPEPDGIALVDADSKVVEFLSYEGSFTATNGAASGMTSTDILVAEGSSASAVQSLQRNADGTWHKPAGSTFGTANACATGSTGKASISISNNGPDTLVVGWQRRAFVTFRDANGTTVVPTPTITWSSDTPLIASVDPLGYATAVSPGKAVIRATIGTTTNTYDIAVIAYEPVKAAYRNHLAFGAPTGMDPSNDVRVVHPGFISSYNPARGGPNWVSWNMNKSHFGDADRCECFSPDMTVNQTITDQDYVSGGYDRGHMVQSESRTSTHSENAATFLLTNILPQAANTNQGPWLGFENHTNDFARLQNKELYIVAGGEYAAAPATLKGAGRVAIPDYTWKVAVVMTAGQGIADVRRASDIQVIAIRMPNLLATAPAKNYVWQPWVTTVDEIERRTGLDLLSALPDNIETAVEANDQPPVAAFTGPTTGAEGAALVFDASSSSDPDANDALTYSWSFGDGATATGVTATHTYANDGSFTVTLTVSDRLGVTDARTSTVTVANVAPRATFAAPSSTAEGSAFTLTLADAVDPSPVDLAHLTYAFDCGAGYGAESTTASASCPTTDNGERSVRARVSDGIDHTEYTATVTITNVAPTGRLVTPDGPVLEAGSFTLSLAAVADASSVDVATLTYAFDCGDGTLSVFGTATTVTCTTTDDGVRQVRAVIADKDGGSATLPGTVTVLNVAPTIASFDGASIMRAERYSAAGTFTDPGADRFTATVNYGDGSGVQTLTLAGTSFSLAHAYLAAGTFTVTVTVTDDDGGVASRTATVVVSSPAQSVGALSARVTALESAGTITRGEASSLDASLRAAASSVDRGNPSTVNQLEAFINKVEAMQRSGRLDATTASSLISYARRIIASIG